MLLKHNIVEAACSDQLATVCQPHLDFGDRSEPESIQAHGPSKSAAEWFSTGVALEEQEKYEEAAEAYMQSLRTGGPESNACFNLANVWHRLGHNDRAAERYHQAIEINPGFAEAWNNFAMVLSDLGLHDQAIGYFMHAIRIDPTCSSYHYNLADVLDEIGKKEQAKAYWQKYLKLESTGEWADYARSRLAVS